MTDFEDLEDIEQRPPAADEHVQSKTDDSVCGRLLLYTVYAPQWHYLHRKLKLPTT